MKSLRISTPTDPLHHSRVLLYGIAAFLIMISAFGSGYLLGTQHINNATVYNIQKPTLSPTTPTVVSNLTIGNSTRNGWQLIVDNKNKFSIEVPIGFGFENDNKIMTFSKSIRFYTDTGSYNPEDCLAECPQILSDQMMIINGLNMRKIISQRGSPIWKGYVNKIIEYIVKRDNNYYVLSYIQDPNTANDMPTIDEVSRTLKFLK